MAPARSPKRSPRARGLRTLQHQTLPAATRYAIDTEVWYRGFILERERRGDAGWATKDQVHDEAIAWFLKRHRRTPFRSYPAKHDGDTDLTFWIDSRLMERARSMAARDGVRLARLIEAAFGAYVAQHVPARLIAFRQWIQRKACDLYRSEHAPHRLAPGAPTRNRPRRKARSTSV